MYKAIYYNYKHGVYCIWDDTQGVLTGEFQQYGYVLDPNGSHTTIYGDAVSPKPLTGDEGANVYEVDVLPETRILIDTYTDSDEPPQGHVILTFDIEVEMDSGLPDYKEARNAITSIALHDSATDEYYAYILDAGGELESKTTDNVHVVSCADEKSLLMRFMTKYSEISPTILTGWNIDRFDIPYLYSRIRRICGSDVANSLSPIGMVRYNPKREAFIIAGVNALDYFKLYKKFTFSQQPSYKLDYIATKEIGRGKVEYHHKYRNLDEFRQKDIDGFIQYNLTDVELVVTMNKKLKFIDLAIGVCHIAHVAYDNIFMDSRIIDGAILTYLKRNGLVAPNKPRTMLSFSQNDDSEEVDESKFEGAYVKPPIAGKYNNVFDLDLTSLYPSILMSLNISPETKMFRLPNWNQDAFVRNDEDYVVSIGDREITMPQLREALEAKAYSISSNGVVYRMDKKGIIPTILSEWFDRRIEYQTKMADARKRGDTDEEKFYDQRQLIQKVLLNSVYGVLGLDIFRYYDLDNAEAVTLSGQTVIKRTAQIANQHYTKIVGGIRILYFDDETSMEVFSNESVDGVLCSGIAVNDVVGGKKVVHIHEVSCVEYNKRNPEIEDSFRKLHERLYDFNIYIDTDSLFMSAMPIIRCRYQDWRTFDDTKTIDAMVQIATELQDLLNESYNVLVKRFFNITDHRLQIKQEYIAKTAFWVRKKRYAQHIIAKKGKKTDEIDIKGLDIVRSSFPKVFQHLMSRVLTMILKNADKSTIDNEILDFRIRIHNQEITADSIETTDLAKVSSVNNLTRWSKESEGYGLNHFAKSCPSHVKAAIGYNRLLKHFKCSNIHTPVIEADKIKYVYLKNNPLGMRQMAFKGDGTDPREILDFIDTWVDKRKMLESELERKIGTFYSSLNWDLPSRTSETVDEFFAF